jgi:hypothetical protein
LFAIRHCGEKPERDNRAAVEPPADRPWGMRDFVIVDPTYVLWRIAQNKRAPDQARTCRRSIAVPAAARFLELPGLAREAS